MMRFEYSSKNPDAPVAYSSIETMHTVAEIIMPYHDEISARAIIERVWSVIENADRRFNRFAQSSPLAEINKRAFEEYVETDEQTYMALEMCRLFCDNTNGCFDISANTSSRTSLRGAGNYLLDSSKHTVRFADRTVRLDMGGFAKGYALEKAVELLRNEAVYCALLNMGNSSTYALGHHPYGKWWPIAVAHPLFSAKAAHEFRLHDKALSISGKDGAGRGHIIDPRTGNRLEREEMIAVTGHSPLVVEVLSTALYVAAKEERKQILSRFEDYEGYEIRCRTDGGSSVIKI